MSDLYKNLIEYSKSDFYPFHMPGHKRNMDELQNPCLYDITEIDGFDNLHEPQGILRIAMEEAAKFYGSDKTYFLVNGSTCGLLAAICGVTSKKDKIIVARNCHKAVYNAIYLNELEVSYIYPEMISEYGINGGISVESVEYAINENKDAKAVVLTSPTYEGIVSDIDAIAKVVHDNNMVLIVDEAHGAHFSMHSELPESSIKKGADIIIQSLHKTLPALTQTALLHIKGEKADREGIEKFLKIYQTSSPSYVLMSSITECINKIKKDGAFMFEPYIKRLKVVQKHASKLTHIRFLNEDIIGNNAVFDFDLSKIVISVKGTGYSGQWLYDKLCRDFHLQLEMASGDYVIAMTSIMDTEDGLLRLFKAITEIDRDIRIDEYDKGKSENEEENFIVPKAISIKSIYDAQNSETECVGMRVAEGRILAEYIYLYPPGIPIVAPGEMLTGELNILIEKYKKSGLNIYGPKDKTLKNIEVVKEDFRPLTLVKGFYQEKK